MYWLLVAAGLACPWAPLGSDADLEQEVIYSWSKGRPWTLYGPTVREQERDRALLRWACESCRPVDCGEFWCMPADCGLDDALRRELIDIGLVEVCPRISDSQLIVAACLREWSNAR